MDGRDIWQRPPSPLSNALFYYPNTYKTSDSAVSLSCFCTWKSHEGSSWCDFEWQLYCPKAVAQYTRAIPASPAALWLLSWRWLIPPAVDALIVLLRAIKALLWPHMGIVRDECRVDPLGFERGPLSPPSNRISTGSDFPPMSVSDGCPPSAQGHFKVGKV